MLAEDPELSVSRAGRAEFQDRRGLGTAASAIQAVLPLYRGQLSPVHAPRFAHPAEAQLAQVFSSFGIRWAYEPTTFALGWHADGQPSEMFTPDFYLPDHRLYIELTTMRQRLVTRKNRKVRLLIETYPNSRVKLVYRRDFFRLLQTFRRPPMVTEGADMQRILWDEADVAGRLAEMAREIAAACAPSSTVPVLLALGRGATRFQTGLQGALADRGMVADLDAIRLGRPRLTNQHRRVRVCRVPRSELHDRPVVLLTDMVSTGLSLRYVQDWLSRHNVNIVHTCALLDRASARLVDVRIDCSGFIAPNDVLAGFGLSLLPSFAQLPVIGTVTSDASEPLPA